MKTFWIVLLTVIIAGGLAGGGTYSYYNSKATTDKNNIQSQINTLNEQITSLNSQLSTAKSAAAKAVATAGWKTGSFSDLTFKYPATWTISPATASSPEVMYLTTDVSKKDQFAQTFSLSVGLQYTTYNNTGLENAVTALSKTGEGFGLSNKQTIMVNGTAGLRYDTGCCGSLSDSVFFVANGKLYMVHASVNGILTQTDLNTFKPTFEKFIGTITF